MYHWIVRRRVSAMWREVGAGGFERAVRLADPQVHFVFAGHTPISTDRSGRQAFRAWFVALYERFPGLTMRATDVISTGWPWATTVAVRLEIDATLRDGSSYHNEAVQWVRLRWGVMVSDWVLEDTQTLDEACWVQSR